VSHKNIRLPYSASIWLPNSGLRFSRVWFTASSLERVLPARASSGSLSAERAPARRALSEMDPRSALKGGSADGALLRHEVTVRASFSCLWLVFGWLGFVSCLFFCSGFGLGFLGAGEKPWESPGEPARLGNVVIRAYSGLVSGIWL